MGIKDYSTTAGNNTAISGINIAEGCPPSSVNDAIRQEMADSRAFYECGGWIEWGHTCTYASGTTFTVSGDVTAVYHASRRVRAVGSGTGTIYGTVSGSSYGAPNTTVTVVWDSGSLSNEALTVSVGLIGATGKPVGFSASSETAAGIIEIATQAEVNGETDDTRVVTALKLATRLAAWLTASVLGVVNVWTKPQRIAPATDNDGSFDISAARDFLWTPTGADALEFTGKAAGFGGVIRLSNPSAYTITKGANVEADSGFSTNLSIAGNYLISYWCGDGTTVSVTYSAALS